MTKAPLVPAPPPNRQFADIEDTVARPPISMRVTHLAALILGLYAVTFVPFVLVSPIPSAVGALTAVLAGILVALTVTDLRRLILPDTLTGLLAAAGVVATVILGTSSLTINSAAGVVAGILLLGLNAAYRRLRGRDGLGGGDVKLVAATALWLGPWGLPTLLLWACATAMIEVLVRLVQSGRLTADSRIPFGPHLAYGTWLVWLYGPLQ